MRAQSDPGFAKYLLCIGCGTEEVNGDGDVHLPDEICVPYMGNGNELETLIDYIFPSLNENLSNQNYITSRAILSTRNDWVDMINMKMIGHFQGEEIVYHSFDSAVDDPHNYYPSEFLNTLTPSGLPPHVLRLKIGCPIILLRNIDPSSASAITSPILPATSLSLSQPFHRSPSFIDNNLHKLIFIDTLLSV
jgi:ATP-dependent DNA helicase PIF1